MNLGDTEGDGLSAAAAVRPGGYRRHMRSASAEGLEQLPLLELVATTADTEVASMAEPVVQLDPAPAVAPAPEPVEPIVEVRRSSRRRRTVSAYRDGERTVVLLPARLTKAEEAQWVATMLEQLAARERRTRPGDAELEERARAMSTRYLGGRARARSVRWVSNQLEQWGSCTPADGTIRLSDRLLGMPTWVIDYVLVHELAHLLVPGHGPEFWVLVERYPKVERARGFLEGVTAATRSAHPG